MRKTTLTAASLAVAGVALIGSSVFAHYGGGMGREDGNRRLELAADVLGVSEEDLQAKIDESSFEEVLKTYGYDSLDAFHEAANSVIRQRLQERGLSNEEIDERMQHMQDRAANHEDMEQAFETVLGLSHDEVRDLRDSGKTMSEILDQQGFSDPDTFHQAIADELTRIWTGEGVDEGTISERLDNIAKRGEQRKEHRREHMNEMNQF